MTAGVRAADAPPLAFAARVGAGCLASPVREALAVPGARLLALGVAVVPEVRDAVGSAGVPAVRGRGRTGGRGAGCCIVGALGISSVAGASWEAQAFRLRARAALGGVRRVLRAGVEVGAVEAGVGSDRTLASVAILSGGGDVARACPSDVAAGAPLGVGAVGTLIPRHAEAAGTGAGVQAAAGDARDVGGAVGCPRDATWLDLRRLDLSVWGDVGRLRWWT